MVMDIVWHDITGLNVGIAFEWKLITFHPVSMQDLSCFCPPFQFLRNRLLLRAVADLMLYHACVARTILFIPSVVMW